MSGFPSHLERKRLCSMVGAMVFVNDAATRPACGLEHDEQIQTGKHPLRFNSTPHLPHEWDAGVLFEETMKLCSDLLGLAGDVCPLTDSDMVGRFAATTKRFRSDAKRASLKGVGKPGGQSRRAQMRGAQGESAEA